jgi:uncharacterized membrane protein
MLRLLISAVVMFSLDMIWIGFIAKDHYFKAYGHTLRLVDGQLKPIWWAVFLVYLALVVGVNVFGLVWDKHSLKEAVFYSALFGLVVYAVYDFTCLSLFNNWPIAMSFIDCAWGAVLCGLTAWITLSLEKLIAH